MSLASERCLYRCIVSFRTTTASGNSPRPEFWNGTLLDDYNFLMSEELICHCQVRATRCALSDERTASASQGSLTEPFSSLNDLSAHHVSYNEFEKQYVELSHWCEKIYETITTVSSNALTRYLRQVSDAVAPRSLARTPVVFRNTTKNCTSKV